MKARDDIIVTDPIIDGEFESLLARPTREETVGLEESIAADPDNEVMDPVLVWVTSDDGSGIIVDGHNRYKLRNKLGLPIKYKAVEFEDRNEALSHALAVQLNRRNLNESQRANAVAKLEKFRLGRGRPSSGNEANSVAELAEQGRVSTRLMSDALRISDNCSPEIVQGIDNREFTVSDAAKIASLPKAEQKEIVQKAKAEGTTLNTAAGKISGGTSFDAVEIEAAPPRKPQKNGQSVVPGLALEKASKAIGELIRAMFELDLYEKHVQQLSAIKRDIDELKKTRGVKKVNN